MENVVLLPPVSKDDIPDYLSLFDVMVIPLVKNKLFEITIPSKLYESMAAGIPVLMSINGEAKKIVEDAGCGVIAEPENPDMIAEKVKYLYEHKEELPAMGLKGRKVAEERFDRKKVISRLYKELTS